MSCSIPAPAFGGGWWILSRKQWQVCRLVSKRSCCCWRRHQSLQLLDQYRRWRLGRGYVCIVSGDNDTWNFRRRGYGTAGYNCRPLHWLLPHGNRVSPIAEFCCETWLLVCLCTFRRVLQYCFDFAKLHVLICISKFLTYSFFFWIKRSPIISELLFRERLAFPKSRPLGTHFSRVFFDPRRSFKCLGLLEYCHFEAVWEISFLWRVLFLVGSKNLYLCRVLSGRSSLMFECHGTAPSACTVLFISHPVGVIS